MPSKRRRFNLNDALAEAASDAPQERRELPEDGRKSAEAPKTRTNRSDTASGERRTKNERLGFEKKSDGGYKRADGARIKKTSLMLPERQVRELKARAAAAGTSVSEYVAQQLDL